jgi:DNA-binding GntR family transcriptional regulator
LQYQIENNALRTRDLLTSKRDLMKKFWISRNMARNALDFLVRPGLAHGVRRRGTFVAGPRMRYGLLSLPSFTEEARGHGGEPHAHVPRLTRQPAPPDVAHELLEEDFFQSSLYEIPEVRYRLRLWHSEQILRADAASPEQAAALGVAVEAPLPFIQGVTYPEDGAPAERMSPFDRGDACEISFTALRCPSQPSSH